MGTGRAKEADKARLSEIVEVLNERFGTTFTGADQLWFDQVMEDMTGDEELADQARINAEDQFKLVFDPKALAAVLARMERNEAIGNTFMTNEQLREVALELMMQEVYDRLREDTQAEPVGAEVEEPA